MAVRLGLQDFSGWSVVGFHQLRGQVVGSRLLKTDNSLQLSHNCHSCYSIAGLMVLFSVFPH